MDVAPLPRPAAPDATSQATSQAAPGGAGRAPAARAAQAPEIQALEIAEQFEALFLSQMLAPMFESLKTDGPFGGGSSEGIYRSLMVEEYGKSIAQAGGLGIAEAVQREILTMQEMQP